MLTPWPLKCYSVVEVLYWKFYPELVSFSHCLTNKISVRKQKTYLKLWGLRSMGEMDIITR